MSSSNSPCAACKFLRRKCTQECVFAPYFPPENPQRFACVHRVFGASNVAKLLNELTVSQRDDVVKSLAYEAEARLRDPVYGCVGFIYVLQQQLRHIQKELVNAKKELASYTGPQASMQRHFPPQALQGIPLASMAGNPLASALLYPSFGENPTQFLTAMSHNAELVVQDPQQQELLEAQQLAIVAAAREQQQVMMRTYEQQLELLRYNSGFESAAGSIAIPIGGGGDGSGEFGHQMGAHSDGGQVEMAPSLALGTFENVCAYQMQQQSQHGGEHLVDHGHHHPIEAQLLLSPQQQRKSESEDGRSVSPCC